MQSYGLQPTPQDCNQPLDFTSKSENTSPSILDLSCKKQNDEESNNDTNLSNCDPMSLETKSSTSMREATTTTGDHHLNPSRQMIYTNESPSQFEVRTFMMTPPSDSDSPNKQKLYSMYPQYNLSGAENLPVYSGLPFGQPGFPVATILANAMVGDNSSQFHVPTSLGAHNPVSRCQNNIPKSLVSSGMVKKAPRPFKAYPKNPLAMIMTSPELSGDESAKEKYEKFRNQMMDTVRSTNKTTNIKMRRSKSPSATPTSTDDAKNSAYWERRRKNNEAAKKSRDARRAKEDEIAIRAAYLERENAQLKYEVQALRNELAKLGSLICIK
ncbi:hypothetical protein PV325_007937 [Microctonus aethiopoides]|uniref:BZIP domain-containing protein n=1 Tax=Microctonus aethiopoides TaxID=144406 RepID=A0AA39C5L2_9HYME|nr:hypothetical protein PV326_007137 [Microctonus aethiopoides]KAK0083916.1 hypothetical protein PV325_007937 [Microctonus aethiopoides]KAK0158319.1 hypothetical protein PV328_009336 [Microctonus aethiopoides]